MNIQYCTTGNKFGIRLAINDLGETNPCYSQRKIKPSILLKFSWFIHGTVIVTAGPIRIPGALQVYTFYLKVHLRSTCDRLRRKIPFTLGKRMPLSLYFATKENSSALESWALRATTFAVDKPSTYQGHSVQVHVPSLMWASLTYLLDWNIIIIQLSLSLSFCVPC